MLTRMSAKSEGLQKLVAMGTLMDIHHLQVADGVHDYGSNVNMSRDYLAKQNQVRIEDHVYAL
jgi:hypothetical protein